MKSFPATLQTHLDSGTTTLAWCWRLTRNDGAVFGFTDHDRGFPHIPGQDTIIRYATKGDANSGSVL